MSVVGRASFFVIPSAFIFNLTSSDTNLRTAAISAGWDGSIYVEAIVPSGVDVVHGTGSTGLTVDGSFPAGVKLSIKSGAAIGGGSGSYAIQGVGASNGNPGGAGGTALVASVAVTVDNLGTIGGGGGGGGSGAGALRPDLVPLQGGASGVGATVNSAAGGPTGGDVGYGGTYAGAGQSGGAVGSSGTNGGSSVSWDVYPGGYSGGAGGAGGNSITGNSNITWINTGTRTGTIA